MTFRLYEVIKSKTQIEVFGFWCLVFGINQTFKLHDF